MSFRQTVQFNDGTPQTRPYVRITCQDFTKNKSYCLTLYYIEREGFYLQGDQRSSEIVPRIRMSFGFGMGAKGAILTRQAWERMSEPDQTNFDLMYRTALKHLQDTGRR